MAVGAEKFPNGDRASTSEALDVHVIKSTDELVEPPGSL